MSSKEQLPNYGGNLRNRESFCLQIATVGLTLPQPHILSSLNEAVILFKNCNVKPHLFQNVPWFLRLMARTLNSPELRLGFLCLCVCVCVCACFPLEIVCLYFSKENDFFNSPPHYNTLKYIGIRHTLFDYKCLKYIYIRFPLSRLPERKTRVSSLRSQLAHLLLRLIYC